MDVGFFKQEDIRYLSFDEYGKRTRARYNKKLFVEEDMYFCKIWKAHRQNYKRMCELNNCASDYLLMENRMIDYENRIKR